MRATSRVKYVWTNGSEFYVAATQEELPDGNWRMVPDYEILNFAKRDGTIMSKPCKRWAQTRPTGYLK